MKVAPLDGDDVERLQVFRRKYLTSTARTSAPVLVDRTENRKHLRLSMRKRCFVCRGVSENRGMSIHETVCMGFLSPEVDTGSNPTQRPQQNSSTTDDSRKYTSKMPRSFFLRTSGDIALTNILTGLLQLSSRNVETGKSEKLLPVDFYIKCPSCSSIF